MDRLHSLVMAYDSSYGAHLSPGVQGFMGDQSHTYGVPTRLSSVARSPTNHPPSPPPPRGQTDTGWPKALFIHHIVSRDHLMWTKLLKDTLIR